MGFAPGFLSKQQPPLCPGVGMGWVWVPGQGEQRGTSAALHLCTRDTDFLSPPLELVTLPSSLNKLAPEVLTGCD